MKPRTRSRAGRWFDRFSAAASIALVLLGLCWIASSRSWMLDLIANLNAQWLLLTAAALAVFLLTRRWRTAALTGVACLLHLLSLSIGRAAILPRSGDDRPAGTVRLFHYNASTRGEGADIEALMQATQADVLSLLCPPVRHQRDIIYGPGLSDRYPGKLVREFREEPIGGGADVTAAVLVSRWPMRRVDTAWVGPDADYLIAGIVERPASAGGEFAALALHPRSPRSPARWALGNRISSAAGAVARRLQDQGLCVVLLTDLNASPTGSRSRGLYHQAGLRRSKPLLLAAGTYPLPRGPRDDLQRGPPRSAFWPLSIALDDVLVSPGITINRWRILPRSDSEHRPIVVDAMIPGPRTLPPEPASR